MTMEEFKFSKLQKAPYLELKDYKAPKGINSYFLPMDDGINIRVCFWVNKNNNPKGTILLQQGHNEFIEKYYETIEEFIERDFSVIAFDWRGQGMSDHQINDVHKAYINDFDRHDQDLKNRNVPGSLKNVASGILSAEYPNGFFGSLSFRYFGEAPLMEDGSIKFRHSSRGIRSASSFFVSCR